MLDALRTVDCGFKNSKNLAAIQFDLMGMSCYFARCLGRPFDYALEIYPLGRISLQKLLKLLG